VIRNLEARSTLASMWFISEDGRLTNTGISMDGLCDPSTGDSLSSRTADGWSGVRGPSESVADSANENVDGVRLMVGRPSSSLVTSAVGTGLVSSSQRNGMRQRFDRARTPRNDCLAGEVTAKEPSTSESLRIAAGTRVDLDDVVDDVDIKEEVDRTEEQVFRLKRVGLNEACSTEGGVSARLARSTIRTCSDISPVRFLHNFLARSRCAVELQGEEVRARISERYTSTAVS